MKQFKAESKKVLDLMINSIYTNKDVFLRELISNASDAIDKLYYKSLNENLGLNVDDFKISISLNKDKRTLTIEDNGIGMSASDLDNFLGVIAKSDSESFKQLLENKDNVNIIGQFGVGFYSSLIVSKKVSVLSKKYGSEEANEWLSDGIDGYSIKKAEKASYGTIITLTLKDDTDDFEYSQYLEEYKLRELIKKYSDYIRYSITLPVIKNELDADGKETANTYTVEETINSKVPLWNKNKNDVTEEELNSYYKDEFYDYEDPLAVINTKVEGNVDFKALIYIPKKAPYDYYYKSYKKGLKLYTNNVLIMDKCSALVPEHFSFIKGVVSADLDLNISREVIQKSKELERIEKTIEKKVKNELETLLKDKKDEYVNFFESFGLRIKFSIYESYGGQTENLKDLLIFKSLKLDSYVTLKEYVEKLTEEQKDIYYVKAKDKDAASNYPQVRYLLSKEIDVLLFSDDVDEFLVQIMNEYDKKTFKSVLDTNTFSGKVDLNEDEEKVLKELAEELKDQVELVKFSKELLDYPVVLSSEGQVSIEMEKVLSKQAGNEEKVVAKKVLEINYNHAIKDKLISLYNDNKDKFKEYSKILLDLAKLNSGLEVSDTNTLIVKIIDLLAN